MKYVEAKPRQYSCRFWRLYEEVRSEEEEEEEKEEETTLILLILGVKDVRVNCLYLIRDKAFFFLSSVTPVNDDAPRIFLS